MGGIGSIIMGALGVVASLFGGGQQQSQPAPVIQQYGGDQNEDLTTVSETVGTATPQMQTGVDGASGQEGASDAAEARRKKAGRNALVVDRQQPAASSGAQVSSQLGGGSGLAVKPQQ